MISRRSPPSSSTGGHDDLACDRIRDVTRYDVPDCVVAFLRGEDLRPTHYYAYGSGRALQWVRMAADALDALQAEAVFDVERKPAEYHAYAGISAARTSLDALANCLNYEFGLGLTGAGVDFGKPKFRKRLADLTPVDPSVTETIRVLIRDIDRRRQRAQHREGLAVNHHSGAGWHLYDDAHSTPLHLPSLLRDWADRIETGLCEILAGLVDKRQHRGTAT